eukprot:TRINITY_DN48554_c0_g1_i1.p1 TRINITY_DN48554_c0_g1~~TRINITY_DN48554_c0_g1_i1.p1  ORF type:complete len:149 (+),score=8.71 TRINITY_DN48554_c0_g1_i1:106-552(+)
MLVCDGSLLQPTRFSPSMARCVRESSVAKVTSDSLTVLSVFMARQARERYALEASARRFVMWLSHSSVYLLRVAPVSCLRWKPYLACSHVRLPTARLRPGVVRARSRFLACSLVRVSLVRCALGPRSPPPLASEGGDIIPFIHNGEAT